MKAVNRGIFLLVFICISNAYSQTMKDEFRADIKAYCRYIEAKNNAKKSILLAPDFIVRAQNTTNDYPYQNNLIAAVSKDLVDWGKSRQIKQLITYECNYYKLNQQAHLQIQFAIPQIQHRAFNYKLSRIQDAKKQLATKLRAIKKKINDQNDTLVSFYQIDTSLEKLMDAEREIKAQLALQHPYPIKYFPLNQLMQEIIIADRKRQDILNKLEKLANWSVQIQGGAQQNASSFVHNRTAQPYGALWLRYNLGSITSNHLTDQSLNRYTHWKSKQINGTQKKLARLAQSMVLLKQAEEQRLNHLLAKQQQYNVLINELGTVDSLKADRFKQQIETDKIMVDIEISYLKYFIGLLKRTV